MKKLIVTITGGLLVIMGMVLIVLPGPSVLLLLPGLMLLSTEYPLAKKCLKKTQGYMAKAAASIDKRLLKRKYAK